MQKNNIFQLGIILLVTYVGNFIAQFIPIPFPGIIIGLVLLFLALYIKLIPLSCIEDITKPLLSNMAFLFIPAGVALINSLDVLATYWWKLLIVIFFSTVITMIITGWIVQQAIYYFRKRNLQEK